MNYQTPPQAPSKPAVQPIDSVVIPDVATQPHPLGEAIELPPLNTPADDGSPAGHTSPVADYVREIQQEFEEQEAQGKI